MQIVEILDLSTGRSFRLSKGHVIFSSIVTSLRISHLHIPTAGIRMGGCKLCTQEIEASSEHFGILVQCIFCKVWLTDSSIQTLLNSICYSGLGLQIFLIPLTISIQILFRYLFGYIEIFFHSFLSFSSSRYGLSALSIPMTDNSRCSICSICLCFMMGLF